MRRLWARALDGHTALACLLTASCLVRLALIAGADPHAWLAGGDGPWYIQQGWALAHDPAPEAPRTIGPVYPVLLAAVWLAFPGVPEPAGAMAIPAAYLQAVRLLQAAAGTVSVALVYLLALRLGLPRWSAMTAAAGIGLGPALVIETFMIRTETVFIASLLGVALVWVRWRESPSVPRSVIAGAAAAAVALVRPSMLPLPALAVLLARPWQGRAAARRALAVAAAAAVTLAPWHIWLHRTSGSWLPEGFGANLLVGAQPGAAPLDRASFHALEDELSRRGTTYAAAAIEHIASSPGAWALGRARSVLSAVAQPHGTSDLGGPGFKREAAEWITSDRTPGGLARLVASEGVAVRLLIYVLHFGVLLAGLAGLRLVWARPPWHPISALLLAVAAAPVLLVALPRYLFPAHALLWLPAAAWLASRAESRTR